MTLKDQSFKKRTGLELIGSVLPKKGTLHQQDLALCDLFLFARRRKCKKNANMITESK